MPSLFGRPGAEATAVETVRSIASVCVSREFTMFALERTTPVATWLQSLARELHQELGREFPGRRHAMLTEHCQQAGVDRVLAFFDEKPRTPTQSAP